MPSHERLSVFNFPVFFNWLTQFKTKQYQELSDDEKDNAVKMIVDYVIYYISKKWYQPTKGSPGVGNIEIPYLDHFCTQEFEAIFKEVGTKLIPLLLSNPIFRNENQPHKARDIQIFRYVWDNSNPGPSEQKPGFQVWYGFKNETQ